MLIVCFYFFQHWKDSSSESVELAGSGENSANVADNFVTRLMEERQMLAQERKNNMLALPFQDLANVVDWRTRRQLPSGEGKKTGGSSGDRWMDWSPE